jgi:hypothetical protein
MVSGDLFSFSLWKLMQVTKAFIRKICKPFWPGNFPFFQHPKVQKDKQEICNNSNKLWSYRKEPKSSNQQSLLMPNDL